VIVGDYELEGRLRAGEPRVVAFLKKLSAHYAVTRQFANETRITRSWTLSWRRLPHDMRYVSPTIYVYTRGR